MNTVSWIIASIILVIIIGILIFIFKHKSVGCSCCQKENCPMKALKKSNKIKNNF